MTTRHTTRIDPPMTTSETTLTDPDRDTVEVFQASSVNPNQTGVFVAANDGTRTVVGPFAAAHLRAALDELSPHEPEPEPAEVERLSEVLSRVAYDTNEGYDPMAVAQATAARGVRVVSTGE